MGSRRPKSGSSRPRCRGPWSGSGALGRRSWCWTAVSCGLTISTTLSSEAVAMRRESCDQLTVRTGQLRVSRVPYLRVEIVRRQIISSPSQTLVRASWPPTAKYLASQRGHLLSRRVKTNTQGRTHVARQANSLGEVLKLASEAEDLQSGPWLAYIDCAFPRGHQKEVRGSVPTHFVHLVVVVEGFDHFPGPCVNERDCVVLM